jgi:hypothetical protein
MRNIYLIDFENVGSDGLSGILNLTAEDRVIIFYSTKSNRLTMRAHILIGRAEAQFTYYEATVGGKNALDHQLSTYLGYLIGTGAADRYYIVSRDNGYRFASNFWNDLLKSRAVFCVDNIKNAQRTTERLLRKDQESQDEATMRTAEDLRDDDLEEGTGEPAEEAAEPVAETQPTVVTPAELPVTEEVPAAPAVEEAPVAEAAPAAESIPVEEAPAEPVISVVIEPPAPDAVDEEVIQESIPEVMAAPTAPAEEAAEAPVEEAPVPVEEAVEAPAETVILFPGNDIDDVPDPNRPHNNNNNNRRQYRQNNRNNNNNRRPRKNQNFHRDEAPKQETKAPEAPAEEPVENFAEKPAWIEKPQQPAKPAPQPEQQPRKRGRPANPPQEKPEVVIDEAWLNNLLSPYPKLAPEKIREMIIGRKKQILCNSLRKQLGQEKGLAVYSEIKKVAWK